MLPALNPAWADSAAGIKVLENFHELVTYMAQTDPQTVGGGIGWAGCPARLARTSFE